MNPICWLFSRTGTRQLLLCFLLIYILLIQYCKLALYRDPTSAFFDQERAYEPRYSYERAVEAESFIQEASASSVAYTRPPKDGVNASLCVTMVTIVRPGARYFRAAVGSLLAGLDDSERADIHLVLFVAQTDQSSHPAYGEGWISKVADTVLEYDLPEDEMRKLIMWEQKGGPYLEKGLFDYTYLLKACSNVRADYIVVFEDDIITMDGWYHRTKAELKIAEEKTRKAGRDSFLYLRLFYTEKFLGWNRESWPLYLLTSLLLVFTQFELLSSLRRLFHKHQRSSPPASKALRWLHTTLNPQNIFLLSFLCTPFLIALFFAAGRASVLPISAGVHPMPRYGCCAQALAYPAPRPADLIRHFEGRRAGEFVDSLVEQFADERDELRWALTPVVVQHVGRLSSKGAGLVKVGVWNGGFERYGVEELRKEHAEVLRRVKGERGSGT